MIEWPQGTTHTPLALLAEDTNGTILDLTGYQTVTVKMAPYTPLATFAALMGTPVVSNPTTGEVFYTFASADVGTPGTYQLVLSVVFGPNNTWNSFPQKFVIIPTT